MSLSDRFWAKVDIKGPDDCWNWLGAINPKTGYGVIGLGTRKEGIKSTHRVAMMVSGINCEGKLVCHHCDNKKCCNPNHLFLGTHTDNRVDMSIKDINPNAKLTVEEVKTIKSLVGSISYGQLAATYGVTKGCISHIANGRTWGHLNFTIDQE